MNTTPNANRKHIGIYGNTNSGKSSLMNTILGQEISLVSNVEGTTTDPVQKAMELIPYGPVLLIDTAGLEDKTELGSLRIKKSYEFLKRLDFAIYVIDPSNPDLDTYKAWKKEATRYNIEHIVVINKIDTAHKEILDNLSKNFKESILVSSKDKIGMDELKEKIINSLQKSEEELPLVGDLLEYGSKVFRVSGRRAF